MNPMQLTGQLATGALDARLCALYGAEKLAAQKKRYTTAIAAFAARFGTEREIALFSVPGRSELSGNHTDHNRGCVIAAAVDLDIIAVVPPSFTTISKGLR